MVNQEYESKRKELLSSIELGNRILGSYSTRSNRFSFARLLVFVICFAVTVYLFTIGQTAGYVALVLSAALFGTVIHLHNKLLEGMRRLSYYIKIKNENLARIDINWDGIPGFKSVLSFEPDQIELDLDLFGARSLHTLIDNTVSTEGSQKLRNVLHGDFPGREEVNRRQELVKELCLLRRMRNRFLLKARLASSAKLNCALLSQSLSETCGYKLPGIVLALSVLLSIIFIASAVVTIAGIYEAPVFASAVLCLGLYFAFAGKTGKALSMLNDSSTHISKFSTVLNVLTDTATEKDSALRENYKIIFDKQSGISADLRRLAKLSDLALYRENSFLKLMLNLVIPYDFLIQRSYCKLSSKLSSVIGEAVSEFCEIDCLIAIANFAALNPDYAFPEITDGDSGLELTGEVHPLIGKLRCIPNDFRLSAGKEIVIITGSNMSGKSTFLRTVGINLCLAYAGAPAACKQMSAPGMKLFTCIKVSDSVFDGISYFYAEVQRLRELTELLNSQNSKQVLFLIDEIFKGTNNRERLQGSKSFIKMLSEKHCTGFLTTHDLELAGLSESLEQVKNFHFREEINDREMIFDYKIRSGPCPTSNALKIMKINGLPVEP